MIKKLSFKKLALNRISSLPNIEPKLLNAFSKFYDNLTPSHSLTSKRFSVWSLIQRYIDQPLHDQLASCQNDTYQSLLTNFKLSKAGNSRPKSKFSYSEWLALGDIHAPYKSFISESKPVSTEKYSDVQTIYNNLSAWDSNLRFTIHALLNSSSPNSLRTKKYTAALDAARILIESLESTQLKPRHSQNKDDYKNKVLSKKLDTEVSYCELCWRKTMHSDAMEQYKKLSAKKKTPAKNINHVIHLSNRFCSTHNPKDSTSKYRADLRYKKAFQHEVLALQFPISERSIFPATFKFTKGYEEELRKAAYDIVHSKLYANLHLFNPNESISNQSLKKTLSAQVLELKLKGMTQAEIARRLGKSRQEVSRANKKLKALAKQPI